MMNIDFLAMDICMIQSEYIATGNQLEKLAGMATNRQHINKKELQ
jgi:hypothetical protein